MKYFPLHCHTHYSLLDGLSQPHQITARLEDIDLDGCAISDHGSISGSIAFLSAMKKAKKKAVLGCELYICEQDSTVQDADNRRLSHTVVLAKNDQGWRQLIQLVSASNDPSHHYYKPRLSLDELAEFLDGSIIGFSGHLGSTIANELLDKDNQPIPGGIEKASRLAERMHHMFGEGNFFLEVQLMMGDVSPEQVTLTDMVRQMSNRTGIPVIATPDAHYAHQEQAIDQRILICTNTHTTMAEAMRPDFGMSAFFQSNNFHIPSYAEMIEYGHTEEELEQTLMVASMIDGYEDILRLPQLPKFSCPNDRTEVEHLQQLCREGWQLYVADQIPEDQHSVYAARIKKELKVIENANLSGYFLICQDIINYINESGWLPGPGRGSAAGCLISYLIGITSIDPILYGLLFERFYNSARVGSLPDIDMDVPVEKRGQIIEYIKQKYGEDRVCQMITYQTMKGRGGLKDVLRAYADIDFEEMNRITKNIPEESKISVELQEMREARGKSSIILWALENLPDKFSEWCSVTEDGTLIGPLASRFAQAIRLEGTKSAQSKHASGVVIAPAKMSTLCPMVIGKGPNNTQSLLAGLEMGDLEAIGIPKFDILGLNFLDKMMGAAQILETGDIQ